MEHREQPVRRINPSGKIVFIARYTGRDGKRRSAGTFKLKRDAQDAIARAYRTPPNPETVGAYLPVWLRRYPRAERTDRTNGSRIRCVLQVTVEGVMLEDWPLRDLRRRHALELVDHLLCVRGLSASGAKNTLRSLSAMSEDAITDEICDVNPFRGVRVRVSDVRVTRPSRPVRVFDFDTMRRVAACAGRYEPMIRVLSDCGLRVGEMFALRRDDWDGGVLRVSGSAWEGRIVSSSRVKNHDRVVPVPPGLLVLLRGMPPRIDSDLLFPTAWGRVWQHSNFYRRVWAPACARAGVDARPHEFRHSFCSLLRAEGVDPADLAAVAGHSVATATAAYTHALGRSDEQIRRLVG